MVSSSFSSLQLLRSFHPDPPKLVISIPCCARLRTNKQLILFSCVCLCDAVHVGKPVYGQCGELVCVKPFPSMPTHFWNDADGSKYKNAYFNKFPGNFVSFDHHCLCNRFLEVADEPVLKLLTTENFRVVF